MQRDESANAGFPTARADRVYLPLDPSPDRPTAAAQQADGSSPLHLVRRLIALRKSTPELGSAGSVEVLHEGYPFVYVRGGRYLVAVNPRREPAAAPAPGWDGARPVEAAGAVLREGTVEIEGFGYGVFVLDRRTAEFSPSGD
jgi:maltose alpha-D-glucosyltransferase/alpha-amylase